MNIRVSILETGRIRIRPSYRSQSADTPVWLRRLRVLCDRHWTEPLPINVYLIEHPEGRILFDCGESPRAASPATSRGGSRSSGSALISASRRQKASVHGLPPAGSTRRPT